MSDKPNKYEIEVLEMMAGMRAWESGSWVNACAEWLSENGYATRSMPYGITDKGRAIVQPSLVSEVSKGEAK